MFIIFGFYTVLLIVDYEKRGVVSILCDFRCANGGCLGKTGECNNVCYCFGVMFLLVRYLEMLLCYATCRAYVDAAEIRKPSFNE